MVCGVIFIYTYMIISVISFKSDFNHYIIDVGSDPLWSGKPLKKKEERNSVSVCVCVGGGGYKGCGRRRRLGAGLGCRATKSKKVLLLKNWNIHRIVLLQS